MAFDNKSIRPILENEELSVKEKANQIFAIYHEEVNAIMDERDNAIRRAEKAEKDLLDANHSKEDAEKALKDYKDAQTAKDTYTAKTAKAKALLKQAGVLDKYIDDIVNDSKKGEDFINALELDEKGEIKNSDKALEKAKADFSGKIAKVTVTGAKEVNPPTNTASKMTRNEIINIKDAAERQAAIRDNAALFLGGGKG